MSGAYYNENDPKAAAWLRELMAGGHIAPGVVDERSITEIKANDLKGFTQCHFFAGIGGWSLALRLAGVRDDEPVWTCSCPCQPFSSAGQGKGDADERHLWPSFFTLFAKRRPAVCFGEQVAGAAGCEWLSAIRADVEGVGYACGAADLCAPGVGAPHIRPRLYWMAYAAGVGRKVRSKRQKRDANRGAIALRRGQAGGLGDAYGDGSRSRRQAGAGMGHGGALIADGGAGGMGDADGLGLGSMRGTESTLAHEPSDWSIFNLVECADGKTRLVEPGTFPLADGVPCRVGLLRGYGNAIVAPLAAQFIAAGREALMEAGL